LPNRTLVEISLAGLQVLVAVDDDYRFLIAADPDRGGADVGHQFVVARGHRVTRRPRRGHREYILVEQTAQTQMSFATGVSGVPPEFAHQSVQHPMVCEPSGLVDEHRVMLIEPVGSTVFLSVELHSRRQYEDRKSVV